jgi:hypothetical protein
MSDRRSYQRRVQSLLDEIERRRRQQLVLSARGVTAAGLRELDDELQGIRSELAAVIAASPLL